MIILLIGNRIGIYGIKSLFHLVKRNGLTIEEVDKLTGPVIGNQNQLRSEQLMLLD
jgi:3-hydroxyacyl-CoA dehydrogenase